MANPKLPILAGESRAVPPVHVDGAPTGKRLLDTPPNRTASSLWRIDDWLYCRRYYAFRWVAMRQTASSPAQNRGSLVHIALGHTAARSAAKRKGANPDEFYSPEEAIERLAEKRESEKPLVGPAPDFGHAREVALRVIRDIGPSLAYRFATLERVLHVEQPFEFDVVGPYTKRTWRYRQRPDLVIHDGGGELIRDWKSSAVGARATTFIRYAHTVQFNAYRFWAPRLWPSFRGVQVGVIDVPEGKEVKDRYEMIEPAPALVQGFPFLIERVELEIEAAVTAFGTDPFLYTPSLNEKTCITSYGKCPYFEACSWGATDAVQARGIGADVQFVVDDREDPHQLEINDGWSGGL